MLRQTEKRIGTKAAAAFLDMSLQALRMKVFRRQIPHLKFGGRVVFYESELMKWLEAGRRVTVDQAVQNNEGMSE
jgi:excisionase family DNA binding protein